MIGCFLFFVFFGKRHQQIGGTATICVLFLAQVVLLMFLDVHSPPSWNRRGRVCIIFRFVFLTAITGSMEYVSHCFDLHHDAHKKELDRLKNEKELLAAKIRVLEAFAVPAAAPLQ